jgi:hypothetical protein
MNYLGNRYRPEEGKDHHQKPLRKRRGGSPIKEKIDFSPDNKPPVITKNE